MANYHPRKFFRSVPNRLLQRYFNQKEELANLGWKEIKETQVEPIYDEWLALEAGQRDRMEQEFREIDMLSSEGGTKAILDEAAFHEEDLAETFSKMKGHHERAFWTFLQRNQFWTGAMLFCHADNISPSYWRRRKNLPFSDAEVEDEDLRALEVALSHYFHKKEGRGRNCKVERYVRGGLDYYFAYPEDYAQSSIEWIRDRFQRRAHHPAFEIIYVHDWKGRTLEVFLEGDRKLVPDLQVIFARAILREQISADPGKDERVYDLQPLLTKGFPFKFKPESGIRSVAVKKLRLKFSGEKRTITLDVDPSQNANAVYGLLDSIAKVISLSSLFVTQIGLRVLFHPKPGSRRTNARTFDVGWPNSCSLYTDGRDGIIRKMLADSGIEPKPPLAKKSDDDPG